MFRQFPKIDLFSFWAGFLAATLFWWLISKAKNLPSRIKSNIQTQFKKLQEKRQSGLESYYRLETLKTVQRIHLAKALFSLDEILIPPQLIAPPPPLNPLAAPPPMPNANHVIPYLPDFPELSARYPVQKITLAKAMQNKANIVIIGQPGSGKTVCIAEAVSQLARCESSTEKLLNYLPIYLHILDLDLDTIDADNPFNNVINTVLKQLSPLLEEKLAKFITNFAEQQKIILFLDGVDELPRQQFDRAVKFISLLIEHCKGLQLITTATPYYLDGLTLLGFIPLSMSLWDTQTQLVLIEKWGKLWREQVLENLPKQYEQNALDQHLLNSWLLHHKTPLLPIECTLLVWAALAGDASGLSIHHSLEAFVSRSSKGIALRSALGKLAFQMVSQNSAGLTFKETEKIIATVKPGQQKTTPQSEEPLQQAAELPAPTAKSKEKRISDREQAIINLTETGLLVEHTSSIVRFCNPLIAGYLASSATTSDDFMTDIEWCLKDTTCRFMACQGKITPWIQQQIPNLDDPPLYNQLFLISRWLRESPAKLDWRSQVFRQLFLLVTNEKLPFSTRARAISTFIASNDESTSALFKQLISHPNPETRLLAALGCGAIQETKAVNELVNLVADPDPDVQSAACYALGAIQTSQTWQTLVEILMHADENARLAAAETFASVRPDGHEILKSAAAVEDLLTRRAVVIALGNIEEVWAKELLQKMSIQDGQWVVRNAASQILEYANQPSPFIPRHCPPPSETPWLVTFASKRGFGISPADPASEILLSVLQEGTLEERLAVMEFIPLLSQQQHLVELTQLAYHQDRQLSNAAYITLWLLSISSEPSEA